MSKRVIAISLVLLLLLTSGIVAFAYIENQGEASFEMPYAWCRQEVACLEIGFTQCQMDQVRPCTRRVAAENLGRGACRRN